MRTKAPDHAGRTRDLTIGFRVTRGQNDEINELVAVSGLTKQDYIVRRLTNREVTVVPNARVQQALARRMDRVYRELRRIERAGEMPDELRTAVCELAEAFVSLGYEPSEADTTDERATIVDMERE